MVKVLRLGYDKPLTHRTPIYCSYKTDFIIQVIVMTVIGTFAEGLYGNLFNMNYATWDYRMLPLSFWNDQINIIFIFAWALIISRSSVVSVPFCVLR